MHALAFALLVAGGIIASSFFPPQTTKHRHQLVMLRRTEKGNSKKTSLRDKRQKEGYKKSYSSPEGYQRGDLTAMKEVFNQYAIDGLLSFQSLTESRYLRYWPGRPCEAEEIWAEVVGSLDEPCTYREMQTVHDKLDIRSYEIEEAMQRERFLWEVEDMKYDTMVRYFDKNAVEDTEEDRLLSFRSFLNWEFVRGEIWYHKLSEKFLSDVWTEYTGNVTVGVDFQNFEDIYNRLCRINTLESKQKARYWSQSQPQSAKQ